MFHNRQTYLEVSRYWVLAVGLLGRYGYRRDHGKAPLRDSLRRDLDEERTLVDARYIEELDAEPGHGDADDIFKLVDELNMLARAPSGTTDLSEIFKRISKLCGITGEIVKVRNVEEPKFSLIFIPHNEYEMGFVPPRKETVSLAALYWLANGFLPVLDAQDSSRVVRVYCLEDPPDTGDAGYGMLRRKHERVEMVHREKSMRSWASGLDAFEESTDRVDPYDPIGRKERASRINSAREEPRDRQEQDSQVKHLLSNDNSELHHPGQDLENVTTTRFRVTSENPRPETVQSSSDESTASSELKAPQPHTRTFKLLPAPDRPKSISLATQALQIVLTPVDCVREVTCPISKPSSTKGGKKLEEVGGIDLINNAEWIQMPWYVSGPATYVGRKDIQTLIHAMLKLPWDSRGYLIGCRRGQTMFWDGLMRKITRLTPQALQTGLAFNHNLLG